MRLLLVLLLFTLMSCDTGCGGFIGPNYSDKELTEEELNNSPYKTGDSIPFVHSGGVEFMLYVDTTYLSKGSHPRCSPVPNEEVVEYRVTRLSSTYPYLDIEIVFVPAVSIWHQSWIKVNGNTLGLPKESHESTEYIESLVEIEGAEYAVYALGDSENTQDSEVIVISHIYYSTEYGILQMGKSNGETFTIRN